MCLLKTGSGRPTGSVFFQDFFFSASLQVFLDGIVFCSHCQFQEKAKIRSAPNQEVYEPRCLPLPLLRHLATDRQRDWWEAVYSLIHRQAV